MSSVSKDRPEKERYHVFAIVRLDEYLGPDIPWQNKITIKKIVWTEDEAKSEVERLNALQKDGGSRYFYQITRLAKAAAPWNEGIPGASTAQLETKVSS